MAAALAMPSASPLPRSQRRLVRLESVRQFPNVILCRMGYSILQCCGRAGFRNTTCAIGTHLTAAQLAQLAANPTAVSTSHSIKIKTKPAKCRQCLLHCLDQAGSRTPSRLTLRPGSNNYFAAGATAKILPISRRRQLRYERSLVVKNSLPASASPYRLC